MRLEKLLLKLIMVCCFLAFPLAISSYAEDKVNGSKIVISEDSMADSFDEALAKNVELNERYQAASPEQQQQIKESWQDRKAKWDSLSDEQKEAMKAKLEERKAKWNSMTDEQKAALKAKMQKRKRQ